MNRAAGYAGFLMFAACAAPPVPAQSGAAVVDLFSDPEMVIIEDPDSVLLDVAGIAFTVKLQARYRIGGVVLSIRHYRGGWTGALVPFDVALAWGDLVRNSLYKKLKWWQDRRWYFWRYGIDFRYDNTFVARHSSNNHIIPASENLKQALGAIRIGDEIELRGYLVAVTGEKDGENYWWYSSMSREDRDDNSCEVIYLTGITVRGQVYE